MTASAAPADEQPRPGMVVARSGGAAARVAIGILGSRVLGLARQTFTAAFLGASGAADAFNAAFKIPNILQNLFGEGALSASFIPVYARLLAQGDEEEAGRVAGAVLGIGGWEACRFWARGPLEGALRQNYSGGLLTPNGSPGTGARG